MNKVVHTIYGEMFEGKTFVVFMDFHSIPTNYGLVN